jgi:Glycosyltransferase (GlcNAc)
VTAYLPPYRPETEPRSRMKMPLQIYPREREDGVLFRLTSFPIPYWKRLREPVLADFVSLHFLFTDGYFNRDVQFDPKFYFMGDEVAISMRAFTNGFDIFHPHVVLGWHCYDRRSRVTHWDDHDSWLEQHVESMRRLQRLLTGRQGGRYGPGTRRSIRQYEDWISFRLVERGAQW